MLLLFATRRRLVRAAMWNKARRQLPARDPAREAQVLLHALRVAAQHGVPAHAARSLVHVLFEDAWRMQRIETRAPATDGDVVAGCMALDLAPEEATMSVDIDRSVDPAAVHALLRWLPPPHRLAPLARLLPAHVQARLLEAALSRALAQPLRGGALAFLEGRRLAVEVLDLGLAWVVELVDGALRVCAPGTVGEAAVRGSATDLLLLASRLEDADTLFFQRRLVLTGDTELGLTARNMLDQLPWEQVPLGLRIALDRAARTARRARAAYRRDA